MANPYICLACGKGFKYEHSLNFHIKSYHGPATSSSGSTSSPSSTSSNLLQTKKFQSATSSSKLDNPSIHNQRVSDIICEDGKSEKCGGDDHLNENGMVSDSEDDISLTSSNHNNNNDSMKNYVHSSIDSSSRVKSPSTSSGGGLDLGLPAMLGDKSIKIESEKAVITKLEGIHTASDQTYILYKCCECGYAFPSLEPMISHVKSAHSSAASLPPSSASTAFSGGGSNFSCEKCGATFKWRSELSLHDQLHKAMDQQQGNVNGPISSSIPPSSPTSTSLVTSVGASSKSNPPHPPPPSVLHQMSPFLSPNFMLLNPFSFNPDKLTTDHFLLPSNNSNNNHNNNNNNNCDSPHGSMSSLLKSKSHEKNGLDSGQVLNLSMGGMSSSNSSSSLVSNILKNVIDVKDGRNESSSLKHVKSHHHHNSNGIGNHSLISSLKSPDSSRLSLLNDELTKQFMQQNTLVPGSSNIAIGEIEETAPGQFKCRYCDKTFDRIFSVHRHERVHTGYKPCICKVCGRGFSEKRNLRHHIIRFHSDGSGRELLKRARKDKTLAATTKQLAANVMKSTSGMSAMCEGINGSITGNSNKRHNYEHGNNGTFSSLSTMTQGNNNNETCVDLRSVKEEVGCESHRSEELDQEMTGGDREENVTVQERRREPSQSDFSSSAASPPSHPSACESTSPRNQNDNEDQDVRRDRRGDVGDKSHHRRVSGHHRNDESIALSTAASAFNGKSRGIADEETNGDSEERITASPPSYKASCSPPSSSRRRKSKPSKKVFVANHDEDDDDEMIADDLAPLDEEDDLENEEGGEEERVICSRLKVVEEDDESGDEGMRMDAEEEEEGVQSKSNRSDDGNLSDSDSNSISGNHSENSLEGASSNNSVKVRGNHGAFFSSYSPRLGIVENPIKRNEACRPLLGPDGKYLYPCGYCQKTFCSLSDLNRHMNFHEDVRPFKCQHCDYQSRTNSQLKVHMMRHAGIKQYLCQTCNYNGVTQSDLNRHCKTRSHVLRSSNVCPLCSLGFSTRTLLEEHLVKFHDTTSSTASVLCHKSSPLPTSSNNSPLTVAAAPTLA